MRKRGERKGERTRRREREERLKEGGKREERERVHIGKRGKRV